MGRVEPDLPGAGVVSALVPGGGGVPGARPTPYRRPAQEERNPVFFDILYFDTLYFDTLYF